MLPPYNGFIYAFYLLLIASYSPKICAAPNPLLQCLAKEETLLHQSKKTGAAYRLNQDLINELASSNDITIKKSFIDEICTSKKLTPSVALLKLLLIKESNIYDLSFTDVEASMRPFKMGYINEFQKQVPRLFVQYIANLQSEMPTPHCLNEAIPELKIINERLKYLEEEVSTHDIIKDKSKIEKIFSRLEQLKTIKVDCEKKQSHVLQKTK